ncbi:hypothetical protein VCHA34P112_270052 [Vibrio chagasii]|nr:hypothetical protein VCHA34P112_270052 [Vibrio chagasii]
MNRQVIYIKKNFRIMSYQDVRGGIQIHIQQVPIQVICAHYLEYYFFVDASLVT